MPVREPENFVPTMSVQEVKDEVLLLNLDNIRRFPISESKTEDFYSLWSRFGPQSARDIMLPLIYYGYCPLPSEYFSNGKTTS